MSFLGNINDNNKNITSISFLQEQKCICECFNLYIVSFYLDVTSRHVENQSGVVYSFCINKCIDKK